MDLDLEKDFEKNFYNKYTTRPPPTEGRVDKYIILKSLLDKPTNCSYLYKCVDPTDNKIKVLKFIKKYKNKIDRIKSEIMTMRNVSHPNVIQMERCFCYREYICIVLPYTPHRSLLWFLCQYYKQGLPEEMAIPIIYQVLEALKCLHLNNIWHRDIKPDNILLFDSDADQSDDQNYQYNPETNTTSEPLIPNSFTSMPRAVLSDFGFAKAFSLDEKCNENLGTFQYFSPELANKDYYDKSVDIWALGITLFATLTGHFPYPKGDCFEKIINCDFNFDHFTEKNISEEAQDLFRRMCAEKPEDRITAIEALKHPWILSRMKSPEENALIAAIGQEDQYQFIPGI